MKLYLISQDVEDGYDTYDSAVVAAESPEDARNIHPCPYVTHVTKDQWMGTYSGGDREGKEYENGGYNWVKYSDIECVKTEYLGETDRDRGVVLGSFNAG